MTKIILALVVAMSQVLSAQEFEGFEADRRLEYIFDEIHDAKLMSTWKILAADDAILKSPACIASTTIAKTALPVELSVSIPKDQRLLPVIYIRITGLARNAKWALVKFGTKEFQPMYLYQAATSNAEPDIYWYAPKNLSKLISIIKANNSLDVAFDVKGATPIPAQFSLAGSTAAINSAVQCAKYDFAQSEAFLKFLNGEVNLNGAAQGLSIEQIHALSQKAFLDFQEGQKSSGALAQLRKSVKPLTDKEALAKKDYDLRLKEVDKISTDISTAETDLARMEKEIVDMSAELPNLETRLISAKADLAAKKTEYDKGKSQLATYEKAVNIKDGDLKKALDAVAKAEKKIVDDTATIAKLEARNNSLQRRIGQIDSALPSARRAMDVAQAEYQRFDERREREDYLRNRTSYESYQRDLSSKQSDMSSAQRDLGYAQSEVSNAQYSLDRCRQTPNANCGSEESQLSSAQSNLWSAENKVRSIESDIRSLESNIRSTEDEADRHARGIANDLYSKYSSASRYYSDLIDEQNSAESEIRTNVGKKIPALKAQIAKTQAGLPGLNSVVDSAKVALDDAKTVLTAERSKIGFESTEKLYLDAQQLVKLATDQIANFKATVAKNRVQIPKTKVNLAKLRPALAKAITVRDSAQAKLVGIQNQLVPFRQQEGALLDSIRSNDMKLVEQRDFYGLEIAKSNEGL